MYDPVSDSYNYLDDFRWCFWNEFLSFKRTHHFKNVITYLLGKHFLILYQRYFTGCFNIMMLWAKESQIFTDIWFWDIQSSTNKHSFANLNNENWSLKGLINALSIIPDGNLSIDRWCINLAIIIKTKLIGLAKQEV